MQAHGEAAVEQDFEDVERLVDGAQVVQPRERAEQDVVFLRFFGNIIDFVQGVVGERGPFGRKTQP